MRVSGRLIILLLMVALLPWGAVVRGHVAVLAQLAEMGGAGAGQVTLGPEAGLVAVVMGASDMVSIAEVPRRCRTAALPGAGCAPEPAVHMAQGIGPQSVRQRGVLSWQDWTWASVEREPPTGPPRLI